MAFDPIKQGNKRAAGIDELLEAFEDLVNNKAELLTEAVIKGFVDKLESRDGIVLSNEQNMRRIGLIDQAYAKFKAEHSAGIVATLMEDMDQILMLNDEYFKDLLGGRRIVSGDVKSVVRSRLGIRDDGSLIRDGYMMGLLNDTTVRDQIKNFSYNRVLSNVGFQDFRKGLKELIEGDGEKLGVFNRFYRNFAFDSYAQVDATNGKLMADKLGLRYFIYNGGIMRDKKGKSKTRIFCQKRAGKVFSSEEAAKWKDDKDLTAIDSRPSYVWQIQRGGFGCRHSIDWISEELAFQLRPELEKAAQDPAGAEEKTPAEVEPVPDPNTPRKSKRGAPDTAWDQIPELEIRDAGKDIPYLAKNVEKGRKLRRDSDAIKAAMEKNYKKQEAIFDKSSLRYSEIKELPEYKKLATKKEKIIARQKQIRVEMDKMATEARAEILKVTGKRPASRIELERPYLKLDGKPRKGFESTAKSIEEGENFYRSFIGEGVNDTYPKLTYEIKGSRAHYSDSDKRVRLSLGTSPDTVIHELGHNTEYAHRWIFKRSVDFLEKRTQGDKVKRLKDIFPGHGYGTDEITKEDKFFHPYVGKIYQGIKYKQTRATEIISMGIEEIYKDPVGFYAKDPEYFNFIYSLFTE